MYSEDDIQYALESTNLLYVPDRRIDTFGDTRFSFLLVSGLMDDSNVTRIRSGWVEAEKPKIIRPDMYKQIEMDGFGDDARQFFDWLARHGAALQTLLQYGFQFRRSEVTEELVHEPFEAVKGRLVDEVRASGDPLRAVVEGVDDAWEVCLLKFTVEMVQKSHEINIFDFRRKGLL